MRSMHTVRRSRSPLVTIFLGLTALVIGGVGTVAGLYYLQLIDLPFLRAHAEPTRPSGVAVPLSSAAIPAYTRLSREHISNPRTGEPTVVYLAPEVVAKEGFITEPGKLFGRVLKADRSAGYAFREKDFLPAGTREGLVAGIPPGQRAMIVEADRLRGVHWLKAGDQFDLLLTQPIEPPALPKSAAGAAALAAQQGKGRAQVKVLAQGATVVQPVSERPQPPTKPTKDKSKPTPPVLEVTLALDPNEAAAVSEALAGKGTLLAVPCSGHPDDVRSPGITPPPEPVTYAVTEIIRGTKREVLVFPAPNAPPLPAEPESPGLVIEPTRAAAR